MNGTIRGAELARIPYVGAGVAGSAAGMDKILMAVLRLSACRLGIICGLRLPSGKGPDQAGGRYSGEASFLFWKPANLGSRASAKFTSSLN